MFPKFALKSTKVWDLESEKEAQLRHAFIDSEAVYQPCEQLGDDEERGGCSKKLLVCALLILSLALFTVGGVAFYNYWPNESLHSGGAPRIGHRSNITHVRCEDPRRASFFDGSEVHTVYAYHLDVNSPAIRSTTGDLFVKDSLIEFYSSEKRVGYAGHTHGMSMITSDRGYHYHAEADIAIPVTYRTQPDIYSPPSNTVVAQFTMQTSRSESGPWATFTFFHKYYVHCDFSTHDTN